MKLLDSVTALAAVLLLVVRVEAQVPENIKAELRDVGTVIDPVNLAALYRPLQENPPYPGVTVARDVPYGPDARNILDVFTPVGGRTPHTVLIFLPGGLGDKQETTANEDSYYDNVMLWAAKQDMVGVNVERRSALRGDVNGEDVGLAVRWIYQHIARYGGDRKRLFIWGHSSGAMSVADYLSRGQFQGSDGVLVRGAILVAGPYNLAPLEVPDGGGLKLQMGKDAPVQGMPPLPPMSPEELLRKSVLPGLKALKTPLFLAIAERDPPLLFNSTILLNDELRKAGRMPAFTVFKYHDHVSEMYSVNTNDTSVSGPILKWIRSIH